MLAFSAMLFTGDLDRLGKDEIRVQGHRLMSHSMGRFGKKM